MLWALRVACTVETFRKIFLTENTSSRMSRSALISETPASLGQEEAASSHQKAGRNACFLLKSIHLPRQKQGEALMLQGTTAGAMFSSLRLTGKPSRLYDFKMTETLELARPSSATEPGR